MAPTQTERIQQLEVKQTADGSPTLFVPELNEHYHSVHGALQESEHVFIKAGLLPFLDRNLPEIKVFEVGFGTGLNAVLAYAKARNSGSFIKYQTIEAFPLPQELITQLHIEKALDNEELAKVFYQLHNVGWEEETLIGPNFSLKKMQTTLQEANLPAAACNVIFFDAFAPEKQPELWEEEIFRKLYGFLQPGGLLVTYCAKGIVKRRLRAAGFLVEAIPGPPGKREMIRACRTA